VVEDRFDQRVNDPLGRRRSAVARRILKALAEILPPALGEALDPVVDGLAADTEEFRDLQGRAPLLEPQQSLSPVEFLGRGRLVEEFVQRLRFTGQQLV
jgi:hypothetical protein